MNEDGNQKLGKRIKQARQEAGMSKKELARRVDRTQSIVFTVENGLSTIDAPDLPRRAVALGKPVMYFYLVDRMAEDHQLGDQSSDTWFRLLNREYFIGVWLGVIKVTLVAAAAISVPTYNV